MQNPAAQAYNFHIHFSIKNFNKIPGRFDKSFINKIIKMKIEIEIDNHTTTTAAIVFSLLIIEFLMFVFKVNCILHISLDIVLCLFLNIYNYKRFRHFQTKKDLQLANKRLAFASLFMNLPFIIGIIAMLSTLC